MRLENRWRSSDFRRRDEDDDHEFDASWSLRQYRRRVANGQIVQVRVFEHGNPRGTTEKIWGYGDLTLAGGVVVGVGPRVGRCGAGMDQTDATGANQLHGARVVRDQGDIRQRYA